MLLFEEYLPWPLNPFFPTQIGELTDLVYYGLLGLAEETSSHELARASLDIIAFETQLADVRMFYPMCCIAVHDKALGNLFVQKYIIVPKITFITLI